MDTRGASTRGRMVATAVALAALAGCLAMSGRVGILSRGEPPSYKLVAAQGGDSPPRPLVIALHGWLGTPEQMARMSGLSAAAATLGVIVVYPEGDWRSWGIDHASPRGATDAAFLAGVVRDVSARTAVDPSRIYAIGFSNGGFMAQALACSGRVRLAGVAVVASGLAETAASSCRPGGAVPFMLIHGTDDPVVPVDGTDTGEGRILPVSETLEFWAVENGCHGFEQMMASSREPGIVIRREQGRRCRGDTEAWFIEGAGHDWPSGDVGYPAFLIGRATSAIDATSVILGFLLRQALVSSPRR